MSETPLPVATTEDSRGFPVYLSYLVVLGMEICLAILVIQFMQWIVPSWDARGMIVVCIIAALEAVASRWLIQRLPTAQRQVYHYRITEWVIILILLKLFTELALGTESFLNNYNLWAVDFPNNIFNTRFILTILVAGTVWGASNLFDKDISLLGSVESSILDERVKTVSVRNLILRRFLNVGMFVVILAGIPPQVVIPTSTNPVSATFAVPVVATYFVLGIILVSLTRYITLATSWRLVKVELPAQISRRWFAYTAIVLASLVFLIAWIPTNYGMGFFATFSAIIGLIVTFIATLYSFVLIAVNYIARLVFRPDKNLPQDIIIPQQTPPPADLPVGNPTGINWTLISSIIFWGALVVLVVIALRQYILFNQDLAAELKRFRPFRWLAIFWKRVTASVKKANKSVGIFVQSSMKRLRNIGKSPISTDEWQYINPRSLEPRQKIIFYYLALLRRADDAGLPRKDGQTPYEYASSLTSQLEEGKDGVADLTDSFVKARYSRQEIPSNDASRVETLWDTLRRILHAIRRKKRDDDNQPSS